MNELYKKYDGFCLKEKVETPKVSIVVPCYNVEQYLEKCLESLIKQTFKDIEIILVNDGSSDSTPEIINEFSKLDARIKVITQENQGLSSARNNGVNKANSEYITFIDSDDWVDENYIERLYNSAVQNNCDIAVASMIRKRENAQKYRLHYTEEKVYSTFVDKINACRIPVCCYACGKLFKTSLVKKLKFKKGVYFEDVIWTPQIIDLSDKLITVPNTNYWYRVNKTSIVKKTPNKKKQLDSYRAKKFVQNYMKDRGINSSNKPITKETKYFLSVPVLKIKEKDNILTTLLFGFLPIFKTKMPEKMKYKTVKKFFFFKNLDSHYYLELFKILKISIKNNNKFKYSETKEYGLNSNPRETKLIVSLTSFPARINTVHITINTLLNQTIKPDKLILWLTESQFPNKENDLPDALLNLKDLGLEIKWSEDLKSYKKLVPALKEYPNDIIVTADDDLYYQKDWLESLYSAYLKNPNYIYTRRACSVNLKNNIFSVSPHYANENYAPTFLNQLMGGAGTLYPPNSLHSDIFNTDLIKTLIPTHDDIYFWIMAILNGKKICLIKNKDVNIYTVEGSQTSALCKTHKEIGMEADIAFERILEYYPESRNLLEDFSL